MDGLLSTKHPHEMGRDVNRDIHNVFLLQSMVHTPCERLDPLDLDGERLDQCLGGGIVRREVLDLLVRVDDGRVVAVEEAADGRP